MLDFEISFGSLKDKFDNLFILLKKSFNEDILKTVNVEAELCKAYEFFGKEGQVALLANSSTQKTFLVGVGKFAETELDMDSMERLRNALGDVADCFRKYKLSSASLLISPELFPTTNMKEFLVDMLVSLQLAGYEFNTFKTSIKEKVISCKLQLILSSEELASLNLEEIITKAKIIAKASNFVRELSDLPPNIAHPEYIAKRAEQVANTHGLEFSMFGENRATELGMGGILAVGAGSNHEIKFLEIRYKSATPNAKTIALVGKGVTFDSGGISIKPASSMSGMKYDMTGAATVVGIIQAIADLGADVNVVSLVPLVENMPGGGSYRQDDIITHMNGTTTEVENTDAEGRLILADAICYAEKFYQPDIIIDIATLTGACVVALGHFFTGMFTNDQSLANELKKIGDRVGDYVWQMPCTENYAQGIVSQVADIVNCGRSGFGGGAITAAMFIKRFVSKAKWVHLDIAGTEAGLPCKSYLGKGATGVGVRLLTTFILEYFKKS